MTPSEALKAIERDAAKIIGQEAMGLKASLEFATPVGNPAIWKTKYPPKGYVGGTMKRSWSISKKSPIHYVISNPMEYATQIAGGRRVVNGQEVGSKQLIHGFTPIIEKTNIAISRRMKRIKR